MKRMQKLNDVLNEDSLLLFHGSKGGIIGEIEPKNHIRKGGMDCCDFGSGFYMGNSSWQAQALVSADPNPYFYELKLNLKNISKNRILILDEKDWLLAVLSNRGQCEKFNLLKTAKRWKDRMKSYDLIVGLIADDSMELAIKDFLEQNITDIGLYESLKSVDLGIQVVAKTDFACAQIEILREKPIYGRELQDAVKLANYTRSQGKIELKKCKSNYRGVGFTLDDIVKNEKEYSKNKGWEK